VSVLKVKDPATGAWLDIMGTGTKGDPGGPIPTGGNPGEIIVKQSATDMDVAWEPHPRVVCRALVGTIASHATANTMGNLVTVNGTFQPDRTYHIFASVRCIADPGALMGQAQFKVAVGTAQMEGYDVVSGPDSGLWGAWSNTWLKDSVDLGVTAATPLDVTLDLMLNAAAKTVYAARIYVLEY
jgi:hypothetical protein